MFAVIDFETTGLSPQQGARAIEIGVAITDGLKIIDTYQSLMDPGVRVPPDITRITGITESMVRSAPAAETVMREAVQFIGDLPLVAHNAAFDLKFYDRETRNLPTTGSPFVCTMLVGRRLYPFSPNHKLATLARLNNISTFGHHRALADADMTAQLLQCMIEDLEDLYTNQCIDAAFLRKYQKTTKANAKSVHSRRLVPSPPPAQTVRSPAQPRPAPSPPRKPPPPARPAPAAPTPVKAAATTRSVSPESGGLTDTTPAISQPGGTNPFLIGLIVLVFLAIFFGPGGAQSPQNNPPSPPPRQEVKPGQSVEQLSQLAKDTRTTNQRPPVSTRHSGGRSAVTYDVQAMLQKLDYDPGTLDGLYGDRTRIAIEAFQRDNGLPIDGQVSIELRNTISALVQTRQTAQNKSVSGSTSQP